MCVEQWKLENPRCVVLCRCVPRFIGLMIWLLLFSSLQRFVDEFTVLQEHGMIHEHACPARLNSAARRLQFTRQPEV